MGRRTNKLIHLADQLLKTNLQQSNRKYGVAEIVMLTLAK